MSLFIKLLINAFAVFVTAYFLSEGVTIDNFLTAAMVAVVLGLINSLIKPILKIIFLPLNIITLGLFNFLLNGLLILLISAIVPGFFVKNIFWAIIFSLVLSLVNWFLHLLTK